MPVGETGSLIAVLPLKFELREYTWPDEFGKQQKETRAFVVLCDGEKPLYESCIGKGADDDDALMAALHRLSSATVERV
jgi:hypothetical protein